MCGLSAIINKNFQNVKKDLIINMNDKIIHRGPDDFGSFFYNHLGLGFRRLSILDLSKDGHQPMKDEKNNVIIFNGEIFNYVELRNQLILDGETFKTQTDTEVILASYRKWGIDCFLKFNGMWGIILYDSSNQRVIISRDRFGIKPLYYYDEKENIAFCSEIKQLTDLPFFNATQNRDTALRFLLKRQLNTSEDTFFEGVKELLPGHNMIYDLKTNEFKIKPYYQLEKIKRNFSISFEEAKKEFYRLFENAVRIRLRSDVPIGSCLSGGLDSSSIVAMADIINGDQLTATTISSCWNDLRYDEQEYIDELIRSTRFKSLKIFPDINNLYSSNLLSKIIYHQDQPIKSTSHFSEYSVFKASKDAGLTVMLDGQGSDEFLAGYIPFRFYNLDLIKRGKFFKLLRELYFQKKNHYSFFEILFHNINHLFKASSIDLSFIKGNNKHLFKKDISQEISNRSQDKVAFQSYHENSINEIKYTSIPYQLHSEDRNSMMHSIESRLPFLDFELTNFILSLPDEMKMSKGKTKRILRESLNSVLPNKIINRHSKKGFEAPEEIFIRNNNLKSRDIIDRAIQTSPSIFSSNLIKSFDEMSSGKGDYDNIYFRIICYQLWTEQFKILK
jgi:asparagine synthase (glutamine-hydrolysing)